MAFPTFNSLASFSASQAAEIEAYVSMVIGYLSQQHTDTGAHGAITADSVEVAGDVDAGGHGEFDGDVIAQRNTSPLQVGLGTFAEYNGGTAPVTLGTGLMLGGLTDSLLLMRSAKPSYMSSGQAYGLNLFDRALSTTIPILAYGTDGGVPVLGSGDTGVTKLQLGTATKSLGAGYFSSLFVGAVEQGAWTAPAFSAGNFTASGAMTWGVDSGDVVTYQYTLVNKTMTILFEINATDVAGVASTALQIAIPGGYTANKRAWYLCRISDAGGAAQTGAVFVNTSGTVVQIYKDLSTTTNWTLTTGDNTNIAGQITFEVQ